MTVSLNSSYNMSTILGEGGDDAVEILGCADDRSIEIEGSHPHPRFADTVFISGPRDFCIEVNRREFIDAIKQEFGLIEIPSDLGEMAWSTL